MTALRAIAVAIAAAVLTAVAGAPGALAATTTPAPSVSAPSAIVVEDTTGAVAHTKAADARRPIASATKLMTALLTLERVDDLSRRLPAARYRPLPVESKIDLAPGERLTVADLLRGLLLESANDAAVTLADGVAGSRAAFVRQMNARAAALGLGRTRYVDPIGIGAGNVSSARDLATLARRLRRYAFFRRTVSKAAIVLESGNAPRRVANRNTLVPLQLVDGIKTGRTNAAGYVLVGSGRRVTGGRRVQMISVVLGAPSEAARNSDTLRLLRWGVRQFKLSTLPAGRAVGTVPIRHRRGAELTVTTGEDVRRVIPRDEQLTVGAATLPEDVTGPLRRGQPVGTVDVFHGRRRIARIPAVAAAAVPEAGVSQQTKDVLTRPVTLGVALAALACSVLLAHMGLRRRDRRVRRARRERPGVA